MSESNTPNRPDRITSNDWQATRKRVLQRDGHACRFCGLAESTHQDRFDTGLHIHHIRPREHMGSDHPENLITVCSRCHKTAERMSSHLLETEMEVATRERDGRTDKQRLVRAVNAIQEVRRETDVEIDGLEDVKNAVLDEIDRRQNDE